MVHGSERTKLIVAAGLLIAAFGVAVSGVMSSGLFKQTAPHNHADHLPGEVATTHRSDNGQAANSSDSERAQHLNGAVIGSTIDARNQAEVTVDIKDFLYEPTILMVRAGTTVTWVNQGKISHDVTSSSTSPMQGLASPLLAPGETYQYTFEEPGEYFYFCQPHPIRMRAVVEVVGS